MRGLLLIAAVSLASSNTLADDQKADELEQFIGHWTFEKMVAEGTPAPADETKGLQIEFTESRMLFTTPDESDEVTYYFRINMNSSPKQIDIVTGEEEDADVLKGIYKNEGDVLVLCLSEDDEAKRPTKFESKAGSETMLIKLNLMK